MNLNQLVYSIKESVSAFMITDDTPIPDLWIEDQIITQNATLIRKAYKERKIDQMLYMLDEKLPVKKFKDSTIIEGIEIKNRNAFCYVDMKPLMSGLRNFEVDFVSNMDSYCFSG